MLIASVVAEIFSAGPAAAAMMLIYHLVLKWSTTAGVILSEKVNSAGIIDVEGSNIS